MEKIYSMPNLYGTSFYCGKNMAQSYVDTKGKSYLVSKRNKIKVVFNNIPILRGLEYLVFGTYFFIKNLIKMPFSYSDNSAVKNISNGLNVKTKTVMKVIVLVLAITCSILLFGYLPMALSVLLTGYTKNIILNRFMVGTCKNLILFLILLSVRYTLAFRQFYRFNGCTNLLNSNGNLYKPTNYLHFILCSFMFSNIMLALLGFSSDSIWKILVNFVISIICFCVIYEMLYLLENSKYNWLNKITIIFEFLIVERPTKTELEIADYALQELLLMKSNKRGIVDTNKLLDKEVTFSSVYSKVKQQLKSAGILDESEADFLICEVLNIKRSQLLLTTKITTKQQQEIEKCTQRRIKGEPITKIFGRTEFYGYNFIVTKDVLSPRQDTEILVENALKYCKPKMNILDMCTGSGIIAISMAKNMDANFTAVDVSKKALQVAMQNAKNNDVKINFVLSNMFDDLKNSKKFDIIVSNPPYIASNEINGLDVEVKNYDPKLALDGGKDGLYFYRILATETPKYLAKNGMLFLEIGYNQKQQVESLLSESFEDIKCIKDYSNNDRVIIAKLKTKGKKDVRTNSKN